MTSLTCERWWRLEVLACRARRCSRPFRRRFERLPCRSPPCRCWRGWWQVSDDPPPEGCECSHSPPLSSLKEHLRHEKKISIEELLVIRKTFINRLLPKCIHVTRGAGKPLTLQSNRAVRPSMTSRMSSLRVNRGSLDGVTFRLALEVSSSVNAMTHRLVMYLFWTITPHCITKY